MKLGFIDHVVLTTNNVKRAEKFYSSFLGKPLSKDKYSVCYKIGDTKLFVALPYHPLKADKFNANRIGLEHLAFGVRTLDELKVFDRKLASAGIKHSKIKIDKYGKLPYIWFDDPDGIRLEFYLRKQ
jgi:catechol 2,3-dioxygenase-like lactoylglutathione lyase family enzyme